MPTTDRWMYQYGKRPNQVTAYERRDKGRTVYLRWTGIDGKTKKRSTGIKIRDNRGRILKRERKKAEIAAREHYEMMVGGQEEADTPKVATLREGIREVLHPTTGKYPARTRHKKDAERALTRCVDILGPDTTWTGLVPRHVAKIWRTLARRHADGHGPGYRTAEVTVSTLYAAAAWLRDNQLIPSTAALPPTHWRKMLATEWEEIVGKRHEIQRPRHTPDELKKIYAALDQADPRLRLAISIGAELRLGQVLRLRRSDLDLQGDDFAPHGKVTIRGKGTKHGEVVYFNQQERREVDHALQGYLTALEAAYQNGVRPDYPLFPQGRLVRGVAKATVPDRPMTRSAALYQFHDLEKAAGVEHVPGRGWYGLRRAAADIAEDFESDGRVLDRISGHHDPTTRARIYQDRRQARLRARAAEVRAKIRGQDANN